MNARQFLAAGLLLPSLAAAATVSHRSGKSTAGDIVGTVIQRELGAGETKYTLLPASAITSIDAKGVHVSQTGAAGRSTRTPAVIRLVVPTSDEVSPDLELALLRAAASDDFKTQMDGMMVFRVETGLAVSRTEDLQSTVSKAPLYGVLAPDGSLKKTLTVDTGSGPVALELGDIAQ